jgi:signal transduction histidine kinase
MPVITLSKMLMRDAPEGSEMREDLGRIQASGEKASKLLRDLLAFSHTGTVRTPGGCEVVECVGRALDLARAALPSSVALQESLRLDEAWIPRDEADLDTILFNLIGNAVDAMPAGKGRIEVRLDRVAVDDGLADDVPVRLVPGSYVRLSVSDDGCGIAGDVLPHIFEPFFTTKAVGKGTGLGLSIAYSVVTQVGGDIAVSSEAGTGARFDVFLPLLDGRPDGGIPEKSTTGIRS